MDYARVVLIRSTLKIYDNPELPVVQIVDLLDNDSVGVSNADLPELIAALTKIAKERGLTAEATPDVCEWTQDSIAMWHSGCGCEGGYNTSLDYTYCPFCGLRVEITSAANAG